MGKGKGSGTMESSTMATGNTAKDKDMASKSMQEVTPIEASGSTIREKEEALRLLQEKSMMESGQTIRKMVTVSTLLCLGLSLRPSTSDSG